MDSLLQKQLDLARNILRYINKAYDTKKVIRFLFENNFTYDDLLKMKFSREMVEPIYQEFIKDDSSIQFGYSNYNITTTYGGRKR